MVNKIYVATPNEAALPLVDPALLADPAVFPPTERLRNAEFTQLPSQKIQAEYDRIWQEFVAQE